MGLSYTNLTVLGVDQAALVTYFTQARRTAFVSPTGTHATVIYDQRAEDNLPVELTGLAATISQTFNAPTLAVAVHDDDVFWYWLYQSGALVDEYDSMPGYFLDMEVLPPAGGNAQTLCAALQAEHALAVVQRIFQNAIDNSRTDTPTDYLSGDDLHRALAQALGLPLYAVGTGYYTIANGFLSPSYNQALFVKCQPA